MAETRLQRFAKLCLESYAHKGTFVVEVATLQERFDAAAIFRELGCAVLNVPHKLQLAVTCPPERQ